LKFSKKTILTIFSIFFFSFLFSGIISTVIFWPSFKDTPNSQVNFPIPNISRPTPSPAPTLAPIPQSHTIPLKHHTFQTFNNCGPAALSMALSYFGINKSQIELGQELRPYQNSGGDNDDKSTTLEELAAKGEELGFTSYHRPNGTIEVLKNFIALDIPVITRTLTEVNEDIGHYRLVRGYTATDLIQDDSLQGKNLNYSFSHFNSLWKQFNYEYLILVPNDKLDEAKIILGEEVDPKVSWQKAVKNSELELTKNPNDIYARFNLSVALYNIGDYQSSVSEFEKIENQLSFRALWYQIEPIEAYYELKNYTKVFEITDKILNNQNRAFSELYIIRGNIYKDQGNEAAAQEEYQKAILYNKNIKLEN
jgi:hypothetical protein